MRSKRGKKVGKPRMAVETKMSERRRLHREKRGVVAVKASPFCAICCCSVGERAFCILKEQGQGEALDWITSLPRGPVS